MKRAISKFIFLTISIIFLSCQSKIEKNEPSSKITFFEENSLGDFNSDLKLILNARFNECGEWGGHEEEMVIYAEPEKGFFLNYKKFKVNCESINDTNIDPSQNLELSKTIKLNNNNKKSITDYLERILKSKIEENFLGHAGNTFSAIKSDSTLFIRVYDKKKANIQSYNQLQRELGFSPTEIKEKE
ncbi:MULTISPECIES: hypothetical protein [Flavobacterium]|uniref:hypothetical protein n=1 Tax=Flavobacterium TaxID=237 RepID=UPI001FCB4542|nr:MULTISPECIES: hypothetical protein [Flavobacterium]UOK42131.1 hypothetical protein LZF87_12530 [Flavobacterium enshiense]